MSYALSGRHFLKLLDFTSEEIVGLVDLAQDLKEKKHAGIPHRYLEGKNMVLIFEKTSTRTRCSFEVAGHDLGMGVTYLDPSGSQIGNKESIKDTARVLGRMFDGIEYRGYGQEIVETLAEYSGVPVWNGLTDEFHPTQMIADLLTIRENFGDFQGLNLVFMGDAKNNVANSLMVASAKMGINFTACGQQNACLTMNWWPLVARSLQRTTARSASLPMWKRHARARTSSTPISGSRWASQRVFGKNASACFLLIK